MSFQLALQVIMLFPPKLTKSATDLMIKVEKLQVAYTLNRDRALELSASFIDAIDAQHWEFRDLLDLIGIPRDKGSISKKGKVDLPEEVSIDTGSIGLSGGILNGGINSGSTTYINTAKKCAEKASDQRDLLDTLQSHRSQERRDFIQTFRLFCIVNIYNEKRDFEREQKLKESDLNIIFDNAISRGMNAANENLRKGWNYK